MKHFQLEAVADYLGTFRNIRKARRVQNNVIELDFAKGVSLFFDMTRSHSTIYTAESRRPSQDFNAPFDTLLHQLLSRSVIESVEVPKNDRVLILKVLSNSRYKRVETVMRLEFTGRNTNAILLDGDGVVLEALHHVDERKSYRVVRPGVRLEALPAYSLKESGEDIDIRKWLRENGQKVLKSRLDSMKRRKLSRVRKSLERLAGALEALPDEENLIERAELYGKYGNIVLANLHRIESYDSSLETLDFDGEKIEIPLPEGIVKNRIAQYYFKAAAKARAKARNIHLERENLLGKLSFYENIAGAVESCDDPYRLELLVPEKGRSLRKRERLRDGELYWIEGYKVFVGRNSKENQKLLSMARANDIWMHVRDIPSSHVIIRTDKQNLPDSLLESAARLCVDFSVKQPGDYVVDYTRRKFVKIQEGSRVEYDKYSSIGVRKEGIEIRE
jgi:predicted ribosome quality control (RQC) complex YloA/Tae2 family protein